MKNRLLSCELAENTRNELEGHYSHIHSIKEQQQDKLAVKFLVHYKTLHNSSANVRHSATYCTYVLYMPCGAALNRKAAQVGTDNTEGHCEGCISKC